MRECLIFRHQMFKYSEPFIGEQAQRLNRFRPLYVGRARFGESPTGAESYALEDLDEWGHLYRRMWQVGTRGVDLYLRLLRGRAPALVHAHFGVEGVYALPLARRLGVPLITTFHGFDATTGLGGLLSSMSPSWFNYALFRRQLARHGDLFLCVSEFIRRRVIALGFPEERTHVHYIGMDTHVGTPSSAVGRRMLILHVARLTEKKGTEYLLRAFSRLGRMAPEAELEIIGDGPLRPSLESLAVSLGIRERTRFTGPLPHSVVMEEMRKAGVLILPSVTARNGDAEGLGMVLLEAAALGLPVIGTQHGGIPEAVVDGETGFLVEERNVEQLADRMKTLLRDESLRARMGARARTLCERRFDIGRQTEKLEAYYEKVCA